MMAENRRKTILVTGCSSGIGAYCARALKAEGWQVIASARAADDIATLEADGLEAFRLDYADPSSIAGFFDQAMAATGGRCDALFNNGAFSTPGAFEDVATEHVRKMFDTNFFGWYELTRRVLPAMRKQGHGRIINCSSVLGFMSVRFMGAYAASKHAVEGWNDSLRLELEGTGIHPIILQPGPIKSRMLDNARAHFLETVDVRNSSFRSEYGRELSKYASGNRTSSFKKGPEAVVNSLIKALEDPRPRARYRVTIPTQVGAWLKRLLPTRWLDKILMMQR